MLIADAVAASQGNAFWDQLTTIQKAGTQTMRLPFKPWKTNADLKFAFQAIETHYPNSKVTIVSNTGSMVPEFDFGDFLVHERLRFGDLSEGDIVTFTSDDFRYFEALTHRIVKILPNGNLQTRGDASRSARCDQTQTTHENYVCRTIAKVNARTARITWF